MSIRSLQRSVAHANMKRAGIAHPNRPGRLLSKREPSFFAGNWHTYTQPPTFARESALVFLAKKDKKRADRNARRAARKPI